MPTALLVIDMQQALCFGEEAAFQADAVIRNVNTLIAGARQASVPVLFVQHEEDAGPLQRGADGWQLAHGMDAANSDLRLGKRTPNSFHGTTLHGELQSRGIDTLVVCGLQTDFCVDTTVRQALPLGYAVVLAADAHSTMDGAITAQQAIAHHNRILGGMTHFGPAVSVQPSADITFSA